MAITKRGNNTYLIRVYLGRDPKSKKRIEVNETIHGTRKDAEKREAILKGQKYSGQPVKPSDITVDALLDEYLDSIRHLNAIKTQLMHKSHFRRLIRPYIGSAKVCKITASELQKLFNYFLDPKIEDSKEHEGPIGLGLAANTVYYTKTALHTAFNYAVKQQIITTNPVSNVKLPERPMSCANPLTVEEAVAFVAAKDRYWYGNAFVFQLHTGVRPGELMALIWDDIDFVNGTARIERSCISAGSKFSKLGPPKTKRSNRVITLSPEILELLKIHRSKQQKLIEDYQSQGSPYGEPEVKKWITKARPNQAHRYTDTNLIFATHAGRIPHRRVPWKNFKGMLRRAGLTDNRLNVRWHDLRHTHATFLLMMGVPEHEVAERLGHLVAELQRTYTHILPKRRGMAAALFASLVPSAVSHFAGTHNPGDQVQELIEKSKEQVERNILASWNFEKKEEMM